MAVGAELLARRQAAVVRGVSNATQRHATPRRSRMPGSAKSRILSSSMSASSRGRLGELALFVAEWCGLREL